MRFNQELNIHILSLRALAATVISVMALASCNAEDAEPGDEDPDAAGLEGAEDETQEIIANLKQAGYPDSEIAVDDEQLVIVGGDAVVTLGASREMIGLTRLGEEAEEGENEFRQYRTTNVISTAVSNICINGSAFNANPTLSTGLNNAIANFNNQNLSFNMTRTNGPAAGCSAMINAVLTGGSGGSAGFPTGGLPYTTINIGAGVAAYGIAVATHVITHELGHCIGLRHSDYYNRSISCGGPASNEGQAGIGGHHIPNTPLAAVLNGSLMNACFSAGSTGVFHAEDLDALHELYGRDCCVNGTGAGCGNVPVSECVGAVDPYCLNTAWDNICVSEVTSLGCGSCQPPVTHSCCSAGGAGCTDNVIEAAICADGGQDGLGEVDPYCCEVAWDGICVAGVNALADNVALPCGSTCCSPKGTPGCDTPSVQACVGARDPYCTSTAWDALCVAEVETFGCSHCA